MYNNIFSNNCMILKSIYIILSLLLFLSIGKQIQFDCSDISRILPESNMSGLKSPDNNVSVDMIGLHQGLLHDSSAGMNKYQYYSLIIKMDCLLILFYMQKQ